MITAAFFNTIHKMKTFNIKGTEFKVGYNFGYMVFWERLKDIIESQTKQGEILYNFYMILCAVLGSNRNCSVEVEDIIDECNEKPEMYVEMLEEICKDMERWVKLNSMTGSVKDKKDLDPKKKE